MAAAELAVLAPSQRGRPWFTTLAVAGLLMAGTAPLWILAPEGPGALPVIAPFVIVPLVVAGAVWWGGVRARTLGVLTAVGLLVAVAPQAEGLMHADSFFDFFPVASMLVGAVAAGAGSAASLGYARRGQHSTQTVPGERAAVLAAVSVLLVLGLASGVLTATGQHTVSAVDRFGAHPVRTVDFEFVPSVVTARAGRTARYVVRNEDLALHTFTIDELGVDVIVKPRSEVLVEFPAGEGGTYTLYCRPHTQDGQGMVGTFTVE